MTILILGGEDDDHAVHMLRHLRDRGRETHLLDGRTFPGETTITFDPWPLQGRLRLRSDALDFASISAVFWRFYNQVAPPKLPDPEQDFVAHNDSRGLFESLLIALPTRWVNSWAAVQMHQTKPTQLAAVARLGIAIPPTIVTNDADDVLRFLDAHPQAIFKPVQVGTHARRFAPEHRTPAMLANLRLAPITVQQEILGTNIRVFVAGERVLACEIGTDAIDFRDDPDPLIRVHVLPHTIEEMSRAIARALHLAWTGIDFRLTPAGDYVFLEANPSPMFIRFESETQLPITEALAALLL